MENESQSPVSESPAPKAFDLKELEAKLKEKGLPEIEGLAKACAEAIFDWAEQGVKLSDSRIDDFVLAVLPPLKSWIMSKLDGISE